MFWIVEFPHYLSFDCSAFPLAQFRILFGLSLLYKFGVESWRGYFDIFKPHTYLYAAYQVPLKGKGRLGEGLWKTLYILKLPAAAAVLGGVFLKPVLVVLIIWFMLELRIYFKYHVNYMLLICVCLLFSRSLETTLNLIDLFRTRSWANIFVSTGTPTESIIPYILISATTSILYISTAFKKLNRSFLSGNVVGQTILGIQKTKRFYFDNYLPKRALAVLVQDNKPTGLLRVLMHLTVFIELALPFGLANSATWLPSAFMGICLHLGFTLLFPATLLHFSVLTIASYLTFLPAHF